MKNFSKPRWSPEQSGLLIHLLTYEESLCVHEVAERVGRSKSSVVREAQHIDYGVKTIDGIQYFYKGIKRKRKIHIDEKKKEMIDVGSETTGNSITRSVSDICDEKLNESIAFVCLNPLDINKKAIDILSVNELTLDAKSIFEMSLLVLRSQQVHALSLVSGSSSDPWLNNDCKVTEG